MRHCDYPPQILEPRPLPPSRRRTLNVAKFWALMDRWKISTDRALELIGRNPRRSRSRERWHFRLSDRQAKVLSCLLEIELTLTLAAMNEGKHLWRQACPLLDDVVPLEALGNGDPKRAATVLWSLQRNSKTLRGGGPMSPTRVARADDAPCQ